MNPTHSQAPAKIPVENLALRVKLSLIVIAIIALVMAMFGYGATSIISLGAKAEFTDQLTATNRLITDLVATNQDSLRIAVGKLGDAFQTRLAGSFQLHEKQPVTEEGMSTPLLTLNGRPLNFSRVEVDDFTRQTGGNVATVFARQNDDFVRIATSLQKQDGSRAVGTTLGKSHPGYADLMAGRIYQGHAPLFGRHYMTQYAPIRDDSGRVIGVLFVGMDLRPSLESLKHRIAQFRIGTSGYVSVIDSEPGPDHGRFLVHPTKEGQNPLAEGDTSDARFVREVLDRRQGVIYYGWQSGDPDEGASRPKIAAFAEYAELGWIIVTTGYLDEATHALSDGIKYMVAATLTVSLILILALNVGVGRFVLTPMLRLQEHLRQSDTSLRTVFDNMSDAAILHRRDGSVVDVNDRMLLLFGIDLATAMGLNLPGDLAADESAQLFTEVWQRAADGERASVIGAVRGIGTAPGFSAEIHLNGCRIAGEDLVLVNISDITQRLDYERQLEYQAKFDGLTGVANRSLLADRIERALLSAARHQHPVAIAFIDLDQFKYINDALGHSVGDRLLRLVAERLGAEIRGGDTVARLGGDEFVVVLTEFGDEADAYAILHRIQECLARPYQMDDHSLHVTSSIGVSLYPRDGADLETLLKNADVAMYRVKEAGRNGIRFFTAKMNENLRDRLALEADLRAALTEGQLLLHYQPQVEAADGRVVGAEALIRWQHPVHGLVAPDRFIPLAEDTGLIAPIGEWVLVEACRQARRWHDAGCTELSVAVNVSALQLRQGRLAAQVQSALAGSGLDPAALELEITESMLMTDPETSVALLHELKSLGIRIALDDFGTGYSSLAYLKQFPIDTLKIDRTFVRDLPDDGDSRAIVATIIAMARNLRMRVVAEGVETEAQHRHLHGEGCHDLQGFLFARPMGADDLLAFLHSQVLEQHRG